MPVPQRTIESFAAEIRGNRAFGSSAERASLIRKSELIAACAFDYARYEPFFTPNLLSDPRDKQYVRRDHERVCARYIAVQVEPSMARVLPGLLVLPGFLVQILFGLTTRAVVEMIWRAAALIAAHLVQDKRTA